MTYIWNLTGPLKHSFLENFVSIPNFQRNWNLMGLVAQILSQQKIGLLGLYTNLFYFHGHGKCFRKSRNSTCRSAGRKVSGFGYTSEGQRELIKSCYSFEYLSAQKRHGPTLTGASFAFTSEVWTSATLELLKIMVSKSPPMPWPPYWTL
jgi:hypothetical protein